MRQNRWNSSTGVIEVNYPDTMTAEDVQDFKDHMAITFRILERKVIAHEEYNDQRNELVSKVQDAFTKARKGEGPFGLDQQIMPEGK